MKELNDIRNFIERYFIKQVEETGVYHKDLKEKILNNLDIIEQELEEYEQYKAIEDKLGIDVKTIYNIIINGFSGTCDMRDFGENNRIAIAFRQALEDVKTRDICSFDTEDMKRLIKLSDLVFLKDEEHDFKYIEVSKDHLYVETKDRYFTVDNEGNKIE